MNSAFTPMLAKKFDASNKNIIKRLVSSELAFQPKLDGIRCWVRFGGERVILTSRQGKEFASHSLDALRRQLKSWYTLDAKEKASVILDGELYCDSMKFYDIQSVVSNVRSDELPQMSLRLYDMYDESKPFMAYERRAEVCRIVSSHCECCFESASAVRALGYDVAPGHKDADELARIIDEYHGKYVSEGYEGLIIRTMDGMYQPGKRPNDLIKYKKFQDQEYVICCIDDGQGKNVGIPTLTLRLPSCEIIDPRNMSFCCVLNGSEDKRRDVWNNREKYIGKKATVKFFEKSSDNIPRFPVCVGIRDYE